MFMPRNIVLIRAWPSSMRHVFWLKATECAGESHVQKTLKKRMNCWLNIEGRKVVLSRRILRIEYIYYIYMYNLEFRTFVCACVLDV
jgi:antibiotic biosynthesis monooxygenase (ABM) superfamily enzyme